MESKSFLFDLLVDGLRWTTTILSDGITILALPLVLLLPLVAVRGFEETGFRVSSKENLFLSVSSTLSLHDGRLSSDSSSLRVSEDVFAGTDTLETAAGGGGGGF